MICGLYFLLVVLYYPLTITEVLCKTLHGSFNPILANKNKGQYLGSFTYFGPVPVILLHLSHNATAAAKLYLFLEQDWQKAVQIPHCQEKFSVARFSKELNLVKGNLTGSLISLDHPQTIHLVYADEFTCSFIEVDNNSHDGISEGVKKNMQSYSIQMLNPDSLGNPTVHFSAEEAGLLRFYQLITLVYFVVACISGPQLYDTLTKVGPMNFVIQLLTAAVILQGLGSVFSVLYLRGYSQDGMGSPLLKWMSGLVDMLSHIVMLYLLLSLSYGSGSPSTNKVAYISNFQQLRNQPAAKAIAVIAVIQTVLYLWEEESSDRPYYSHRSYAGVTVMLIWVGLAVFFGTKLYFAVSSERSLLKREFYKSFTKTCLLWFLCFPVLVVISWILTPYMRYKFVTISVELCQSAAVVLLYRLFMSRSLFWEISSIGSVLPLKIDRKTSKSNISIKIHS